MAHTTGPRPNNDTDYGTVGNKTLRAASQIGNSNGPVDFNRGPSTDQTIRVSLADGAQVTISDSGNGVYAFGENPAIPVGTPTEVVAYIPTEHHTLKMACASGMADASFDLKVDGVTITRKRNNWTDRNIVFDIGEQGIPVSPGIKISIEIMSQGDGACPFEATIFGEE